MSKIIPSNGGDAIVIAPPAVAKDPLSTYLLSLQSKESRRAQFSALRMIGALLGVSDPRAVPWPSITYAHALAIRDRLGSTLAPATAQRYFAALRGVLREAWRLRLLDSEEWQRIDDIKAPKGSSAETGRALSAEEIRKLFNATGDHYIGRRDAALVAVSVFAGARRFEAAGLTLDDWRDDVSEIRIRGKGRKERVVRLAPLARFHLRRWIAARGSGPGPLLYGHKREQPIGYSTVDAILKRVAMRAGVDAFTPHDMRRTFVTRILEMTGDISLAQKAAGHANSNTTAKYDKRKSEATKQATERLDEGI